MAEIVRRNSTFRITVSLGRDSSGKKKRVSTTFKPTRKTESAQWKEANEFAVIFEKQVRSGKAYDLNKATFQEFAQQWREEWAASHLTQSQVEQYQRTLERVIFPAIGSKQLSKVSALDCQAIINSAVKRGKAPKTVRRYVTAMNSVLRFAYKMNLIQENPVSRTELPKLQKDTGLHYFNVKQAKEFIAALDREFSFTREGHDCERKDRSIYHVESYTITHTVPLQLKAYFIIAIYSGFRRGEMIGLDWSAIDFKKKAITIRQAAANTESGEIIKGPKTESGYRSLILPEECFTVLKEWKQEQSAIKGELGSRWQGAADEEKQPVFIQENGRRMNLYTPGQAFDRILHFYNEDIQRQIEEVQNNRSLTSETRQQKIKALEEEKLPIIRLHDLRHTSATLLIASGMDIETICHRMGHSEPSITLNVYGHPMESQDDKASEILGNLLG